jgi:hypothetical protein
LLSDRLLCFFSFFLVLFSLPVKLVLPGDSSCCPFQEFACLTLNKQKERETIATVSTTKSNYRRSKHICSTFEGRSENSSRGEKNKAVLSRMPTELQAYSQHRKACVRRTCSTVGARVLQREKERGREGERGSSSDAFWTFASSTGLLKFSPSPIPSSRCVCLCTCLLLTSLSPFFFRSRSCLRACGVAYPCSLHVLEPWSPHVLLNMGNFFRSTHTYTCI